MEVIDLSIWDCSKNMTAKEKAKDQRLRREYNITLTEWKAVFEFQCGVCFICQRKLTKKGKPFILATDHRHKDGLIRGLLCWQCNKAIAILQDTVEWAQRAADYLANPPFVRLFGARRTAPGKVGTKVRAKLLKKMSKIRQEKGEK